MPGRSFSSNAYKYGFNGKEKDDEIKGSGNNYDFGDRMQDPRLGRWLSIDKLADRYTAYSPYNFACNTPIAAIDPNGKNVIVIVVHTWAGGQNPGHTLIAVDNYKKAEEDVYDNAGNVSIHKGDLIPDGTVTIYDLHAVKGFNFMRMLKSNKSEAGYVTMDKNMDKRKFIEKYLKSKSGVTEIILSPELTSELKSKIDKEQGEYDNKNQKYDMVKNNCVDFVAKFVKQIHGFEDVSGIEKIQPDKAPAQYLQELGVMPKTVSTPDFLQKSLNETISKNSSLGKVIDKGAETGRAFIDNMSSEKVHDVKPNE